MQNAFVADTLMEADVGGERLVIALVDRVVAGSIAGEVGPAAEIAVLAAGEDERCQGGLGEECEEENRDGDDDGWHGQHGMLECVCEMRF